MTYKRIKRADEHELYLSDDGSSRAIKISWGDVTWLFYYADQNDAQIIEADAIARYGTMDEQGDFVCAEYDDNTARWVAPEKVEAWGQEWLESYEKWARSLNCISP